MSNIDSKAPGRVVDQMKTGESKVSTVNPPVAGISPSKYNYNTA